MFYIIGSVSYNPCYAQSISPKKDTIYYFLDTLNISSKDRMITSSTGPSFTFYRIQCPCLKDGVEPVFRAGVAMKKDITQQTFLSYKLISLPDLISFVKKNDDKQFDKKHVIYFVERRQNGYIQNRVFFQGGGIERTIDYQTISTGNLPNNKHN